MFLRWLTLAAVICLSIEGQAQVVQSPVNDADDALHELGRLAEVPPALALPALSKLTELDQAYLDTYIILRERNSCSSFFGGPAAIEALNEMVKSIKPTVMDRRVGLRMEGESMTVINARNNFQYRLFPRVEINVNGPFYKRRGLPGQATIPMIGVYLPGTREARITLLLHELGHLVRKGKGEWLLRDDGRDVARSFENTGRILDACRAQIHERQRFSFGEELAAVRPKPDVTAEVLKNPAFAAGSTDRFVPAPGRFVPN